MPSLLRDGHEVDSQCFFNFADFHFDSGGNCLGNTRDLLLQLARRGIAKNPCRCLCILWCCHVGMVSLGHQMESPSFGFFGAVRLGAWLVAHDSAAAKPELGV